jgi:hypothetical protein
VAVYTAPTTPPPSTPEKKAEATMPLLSKGDPGPRGPEGPRGPQGPPGQLVATTTPCPTFDPTKALAQAQSKKGNRKGNAKISVTCGGVTELVEVDQFKKSSGPGWGSIFTGGPAYGYGGPVGYGGATVSGYSSAPVYGGGTYYGGTPPVGGVQGGQYDAGTRSTYSR